MSLNGLCCGRLEELVKLLLQDSAKPPHAGFRLWLVSAPCLAFPPGLLQAGVRMVWEAPQVLPRYSALLHL